LASLRELGVEIELDMVGAAGIGFCSLSVWGAGEGWFGCTAR